MIGGSRIIYVLTLQQFSYPVYYFQIYKVKGKCTIARNQ
jgi:hypothetical protein